MGKAQSILQNIPRKARTEVGRDDTHSLHSKKGPRSVPDTRKKSKRGKRRESNLSEIIYNELRALSIEVDSIWAYNIVENTHDAFLQIFSDTRLSIQSIFQPLSNLRDFDSDQKELHVLFNATAASSQPLVRAMMTSIVSQASHFSVQVLMRGPNLS